MGAIGLKLEMGNLFLLAVKDCGGLKILLLHLTLFQMQ